MTGCGSVEHALAGHIGQVHVPAYGEEFMRIIIALVSVLWIILVLLDGFESMILPRCVTRVFRLARFYYRGAWALCVCWGNTSDRASGVNTF